MNKPIILHALHGFLGHSSDWNNVTRHLKNIESFRLYDLFANPLIKTSGGLWSWAQNFNELAAKNSSSNAKHVLLGYSLGGRLALHAIIQNPSIWSAAIIVSAHPGLKDKIEKKKKLKNDMYWAERFKADSWDGLIKDWNSQSVLKGSLSLERLEEKFSRENLACALEEWSLGKQDDLSTFIKELSNPFLWLAGENDEKYSSMLKSLSLQNPLSHTAIIEKAGHRVPWDHPAQFQKKINQFIQTLLEIS